MDIGIGVQNNNLKKVLYISFRVKEGSEMDERFAVSVTIAQLWSLQ